MRYKYVTCLLLFAIFALPVLAQEEEEEKGFNQPIQEFPFAESVYLQEKNEIQNTSSYLHTAIENLMQNSLGFEVEYGITDWLQISSGFNRSNWQSLHTRTVTKQIELGTKAGILNTPLQALSIELEVEFPFKTADLEDQEIDGTERTYTPTFIYARQIGPVQVHLNGGGEFEKGGKEWFYHAAAVYGKGHWHPTLEVNGTYEEEANWYLAPGIVLNGDKGWEFVGGVRRSLVNRDWGASVMLIYEFVAGKK